LIINPLSQFALQFLTLVQLLLMLHVIAPLLLNPLVYAQQFYIPALLYVTLYVVLYAILPRYLPDIEAFHLPSDRIFFATVEFRSFALQYHLIDFHQNKVILFGFLNES